MKFLLIIAYLFLVSCAQKSMPTAESPAYYAMEQEMAEESYPPPAPISEEERLRERLIRKQTERMEAFPPSSGFSSPIINAPSALDVMSQLQTAAMAFNLADRADIEQDILAQLKVDYHLTKEQLAREMDPQPGQYYVVTEDIKVSKILKAELVAPGFDVNPLTAGTQALSESEPTTWEWLLIPNAAGKHLVTLKIDALVQVGDDKIERTVQTYKKTLMVTVTTEYMIRRWLDQHWQWLLSALVFPVFAWYWINRKKKSKR